MKQLDLAAVFRDYEKDLPESAHLPAAVLENCRRRAKVRIQDALASCGSDTVPPELVKEVRQLIRRWARQSFADGFQEMEEFEIRCAREHDLIVAQASGNRTVRTFTSSEITTEAIAELTDCDEQLVQHALETNRAMQFVDGIDEVPRDMAPQLLQSLVQFCKTYPKASIVITSRPSGVARDHSQALPDFASAELHAMARDEVDNFIGRWCLAAELSVSNDSQTAERRAQEAATDLKQRLDRSRPIQRLVETPLLATILCVVHRFLGPRIPEHRVALHEKCTDALLYEWDRSKFGHAALVGELDALAKRKLLSGLARQMHDGKQAEVPEVEVLGHFKQGTGCEFCKSL